MNNSPLVFARRCGKEILRDPLNIAFGLGFPLVIMFLLFAIQSNIPVEIFKIEHLAPGILVFGLSFISLFSGTLIAKDRTTWFLTRLFASPLRSGGFIVGYALPMLPIAMGQSIVCFAAALLMGLELSFNILVALVVLIPTAIMFIGLGLLAGSLFNDKQVGGICGALLTNLCAWMSGAWFDLELVGGTFKKTAYLLPFVHAVRATEEALAGSYSLILPHLWWVMGYAAAIFALAVFVFKRRMHSNNM